ncbi:MAG TPA: CocE/NonD family hydrolase [Actinomycetota bacterium]|nr:CocE/NonD family hydrolase [Actinomycetota bacterium]
MKIRAVVLLGTLALASSYFTPSSSAREQGPAPSVVEEYRVPTEWGTIYGWVERPAGPDKVPIILTYSPYAATTSPAPGEEIDFGDGTVSGAFVPRGYARALFHLVGTGNSGGCYDYGGLRERKTGYAVVEFLGEQPWSNGRVGMLGGSYDGTTQLAAAVENPPHLVTIIPQVPISRWYDYTYGQGVRFYSGFATPLVFDVGYNQIPMLTFTPTDPATAEALVDSVRPCETLYHQQRGFLPDPVYDGFWAERDYRIRAENIRASVLLEGSWVDYNVHPINSIEMWKVLPRDIEARLVMGQQGHAGANLTDSAQVRLAWFDYWLKGENNDILKKLPTVTSQLNNQEIVTYEKWPPRGTRKVKLPLLDDTAPNTLEMANGDSQEWNDFDPLLSEVDVLAGRAPSTSVLFFGPPLEEPLHIAGSPRLKTWVTSNMESTHLTPVLFDESPDGVRRVITRGLLNSRNRESINNSLPIPLGVPWGGIVRFQPTDYVLPVGHRLGVAMMSMNRAEALYPDETRATNEIELKGRTMLLLTVIAPDTNLW